VKIGTVFNIYRDREILPIAEPKKLLVGPGFTAQYPQARDVEDDERRLHELMKEQILKEEESDEDG
jgi:hypothetical protein